MTRVPSTATLCHAFQYIVQPRNLHQALDVLVDALERVRLTGKTLATDSTFYDTHHFTRHYEYR